MSSMGKDSALRKALHWQYSGVVLPLLFGIAVTFMLATKFFVANILYSLAGLWAILWWLRHDYVRKKQEFLKNQIERRRLPDKARKAYWIAVCAGITPIVVITTIAIMYGRHIQSEESLKDLHGWLYPDGTPDPYGICHPTGQELAMYVGSYSLMGNSFPQSLVAIHSVPVVTIDRREDGAIGLSLTIRSPDQKVIVEMDDGEFTVNPNNVLRMYRPDPSRLTIRDQWGNEVFNAHYLNKSAIRLEAKFYQNGKAYDLSAIPLHNMCLARIVPPGIRVTGNMINLAP